MTSDLFKSRCLARERNGTLTWRQISQSWRTGESTYYVTAVSKSYWRGDHRELMIFWQGALGSGKKMGGKWNNWCQGETNFSIWGFSSKSSRRTRIKTGWVRRDHEGQALSGIIGWTPTCREEEAGTLAWWGTCPTSQSAGLLLCWFEYISTHVEYITFYPLYLKRSVG